MNDNQSEFLEIKGLRDGLLVSLADAPWDELQAALIRQIEGRQSFFQGARLALNVGNQALKVADLVELRDQLSERGVSLWAVISDSSMTESTSQLLGLATRISKPKPDEARQFAVSVFEDQTALWVNRTLRSGVRIEYSGHIVVYGDVNPGAEIAASGSVLIWGRLRGVVHAGKDGDSSVFVCALDFSPTQLRIENEIAVLPQEENVCPKKAQISDGKIVLEPWVS
ncbi:MAG: septum site-determining protein MinC [Anaerolineales bacterium]|nr:septum site-determining protein MinC [Anaerolineales bacterium]